MSALAARAGITRPTLYRNYPALIDKFLAAATAAATTERASHPRSNGDTDQLQQRIAKLRAENQQLCLHLDLYEEHIRRLTIENDKLRTELGQTPESRPSIRATTSIRGRDHACREYGCRRRG